MTKKYVLGSSVVGIMAFLISMYSVVLGVCEKSDYYCRKNLDIAQNIFGIFIPIFFFSLITFKMREEVFRAWWNFARWFAPVIVLVTFLLNAGGNGSGFAGAVGKSFDMFVLGLLYAVLVVVSIVKIFLAQRKLN